MSWIDLFRLFQYAFEEDPQTKRINTRDASGAGISSPDTVPYTRQDGSFQSAGKGMLRVGNDFVDLTSISNRVSRYKEYERLRSIPEIEQVMTVIADEACLAGDTKINTLYDGLKTIKWLAENKKDEEFFVYSWDFEKNDYTLAVAFNPRLIKTCKTIKIILDDGTKFRATPDHLVLLRNGAWATAGSLVGDDELMPFYRIPANFEFTENRHNQFPRIWTHQKGWIHERQFINEWKAGRNLEEYEELNAACRAIAAGLSTRQCVKLLKHQWITVHDGIKKAGFSCKELKWLGRRPQHRRVISAYESEIEEDVYDLSVKEHKNFCGESAIFHNCQKDAKGNVLEVKCKNQEIKEEIEFLLLNRGMLNMNRKIWSMCKRLCMNGDGFYETVIDPEDPKTGIVAFKELPPESMYRIETTKGKLVEFQQSNEGPDYEALAKGDVNETPEAELEQSKAIRFTPNQIIHLRLGEDRKTFYPYGQSLIEPARGPAHQLRLMEDAMLVYRLSRSPERKVFYIDIGGLTGFRAESFMSRVKDLLRKRKVVNKPGDGASAVDEKWSAMSVDEDIWIPVRPNSNTRVETLPGAQNLGEVDDSLYFRNKLFTALNFPSNYFSNEDVGATRITLSSRDARFARMIERIQEPLEDGLWDVSEKHLKLRGFPPESYKDLAIKLTIPSEWRELSRAEVENNRINNANALKGSLLYPDYDILTKILKLSGEEAEEMISRMKLQKLDEAKLQILVQNPQILGVGIPGQDETQMGTEPGGPSPMLPPEGEPDKGKPENQAPENQPQEPPKKGDNGQALPEPEEDEIKRFDLEIQSYAKDQDAEDIDFSES